MIGASIRLTTRLTTFDLPASLVGHLLARPQFRLVLELVAGTALLAAISDATHGLSHNDLPYIS